MSPCQKRQELAVMLTRDELAREVEAAFAERPYPGDDALTWPPSVFEQERDATQHFFQGKDWRELTADSILKERSLEPNFFLSYLRGVGFLYFIPGLLKILLEPDCDDNLEGTILNQFGGPSWGGSDDVSVYFLRTMSELTREEWRAIVNVIDFLACEYRRRNEAINDPQEMLDDFWREFSECPIPTDAEK